MYGAVAGILVPAQLAKIDPLGKEVALAVTMAASSALTLVVKPLVGMLSDRTRSRWGRRSPWIAGGAIGAGFALVALGQAGSVVAVAAGWLIVQPLLNVVEAPLDAVLADRVPVQRRPRAAAFVATGVAVGLAVGALVAATAVRVVGAAYAGLAVILVLTMLTFVFVERDEPATTVRASLPLRQAWAGRDLRLVFGARFVIALGHQVVLGYLLYAVMDRTGSSAEEASSTSSALMAMHIGGLVLGAVVAGALVKRRRVPWAVAGSIVVGLALLVPIVLPGVAGLAAYAALAGLGRGVYLTADLALMVDVLPSRADNARDLGVLGLATNVPQTLAPVISVAVLSWTGNLYVALFAVGSLLVLASAVIVSRVREASSSRP